MVRGVVGGGIIQGKSLIEGRLVFEEIQCTVILSIIFSVFVVMQVQLWALLACIVFLLMLVLGSLHTQEKITDSHFWIS